LGRNISGFELPPPLYEGNTFDSKELTGDEDLVLAMRLRNAMTESMKVKIQAEMKIEEDRENEEDEDVEMCDEDKD
jgi:hypothetical protein